MHLYWHNGMHLYWHNDMHLYWHNDTPHVIPTCSWGWSSPSTSPRGGWRRRNYSSMWRWPIWVHMWLMGSLTPRAPWAWVESPYSITSLLVSRVHTRNRHTHNSFHLISVPFELSCVHMPLNLCSIYRMYVYYTILKLACCLGNWTCETGVMKLKGLGAHVKYNE